MKKQLALIPLIIVSLPSCTMVNETMAALERNREAVEYSTMTINENRCAIEESSRAIAENRRQLEEINKTLEKAKEM
jgi:hypothetical protein